MPKPFKPQINDTTVYIQGRLSYPHLFEPKAPEGQEEKVYSCCILIDKSDTASVEAINKAVEAAVNKGLLSKFEGKRPKKLVSPLRDGDEKDGEEFQGKWFLNAKGKGAPGVVDRNKAPILNAEEVYGGCWCVFCLNMFPYKVSGNTGVGAGLNAVMKVADGEAFGDGGNRARAFDNIQLPDEDDDEDGLV